MYLPKTEIPYEAWEQEALFSWIKANQNIEPKLMLAYSTLNGIRLSTGLRTKAKKQGNRKGVPDIVLPAKSFDGKYPGLYIELKRIKGGVVSKDQKEYMALLTEQGYCVKVCKGHQNAINVIKAYFGGKLNK
ncbi:MAG: VRR-NUC domain-containing protein [Planctomycetes bacterium]|nr:VRR-NUC domain-containing protein [Planctomycetota bacterium]